MAKKKPIVLGIIGIGKWGLRYVDTAARLWPDGTVTFKYRAGNTPHDGRFDGPHEYFDHWEDLVFQPDIDGLVIASPATTHYQIAAVSLAHKIPVLIEKPATLSARDTDGLLRISSATKTTALVGHQHLFSPAFEAMRSLLLGHTITKIECAAGGPGPIRDTCSALWDWAPHDLAMIFSLCPDFQSFAVENVVKNSSPTGAESWNFVLKSPSMSADIELSNDSTIKKRRLTVITADNLALTYDDRAPEKLTLDGAPIPAGEELPLDRQLKNFASIVEDERRGVRPKGEHANHLALALQIAKTIEEVERRAAS